MGVKAKTSTTLLTFTLVVMMSTVNALDATFKESLETFSNNLFYEIFPTKDNDNVIYSPLSVHTCLTMARMGAEGVTATEMNNALALKDQSIQSIGDNYHTLLSKYTSSSYLTLANKIYIKQGHELDSNYTHLLENKFLSTAEEIDFAQSVKAAKTINSWVEQKTHHMIKELIDPSTLEGNMHMLLLSAIHFKGSWERSFNVSETQKKPFYIDENKSVQVDMMHTLFEDTIIQLGRHPLCSYIRMPYKDSDLAMMVFLPYKRTGLMEMLEALSNSTLDELSKIMRKRDIEISLPKFKIEFGIELNEPLQELGMIRLFENAQLGKMVKTNANLSATKVFHKAIIEVNEMGTEASAATEYDSFNYLNPYNFNADHPFYYAIVNADNVILFQGAVLNFPAGNSPDVLRSADVMTSNSAPVSVHKAFLFVALYFILMSNL